MISGFRREVKENYVIVGYYAARSGNFLPTFRNNLSVSSSGSQEYKNRNKDGTNRLFWNVTRSYHYLLRNNQEERVVAISYRRFGTTYRSHPQGVKNTKTGRKMGPIGFPETSH